MNYRGIGIVLGIIFSLSLIFQVWQLYHFVSAGPRFTANDGQELCERVKALEVRLGKTPLDCVYLIKGSNE